MTRLKADVHLDLKEWEMAEGKPTWDMLNAIFGGQKKIKLCAVFDPRDAYANQFSQKIGRIFKQKRLLLQERGVDELYLAYPFIEGLWPDGSPLRMPFLFVPISLETSGNQWYISPQLPAAFINPGFLLAYAHHTRSALPETVYEKDLEMEAEDALSYLTALYHKIKESGLEIHFNQELFSGKILPFQHLNKESEWPGFQPGMMKLAPHAVLGLFSQSESMLIPDFEFLEKENVSLEDIFLKTDQGKSEIHERNLLCPLPMDGSQESCIRKIKSGQSIVIQGPPGTGKSQVIANLMADAMGSGKTVLLVCQKRVALEVVQKRLKELDLDAFVAMWSDFKKDRDPLYNKLAKTIENLEDTEADNQHLDTVILERNFLKVCQKLEEITQKLENWKMALFDKSLAGISVRELYEAEKKEVRTNFESKKFLTLKWEEWQWFKSWFLRYRFDFQTSLEENSILAKRKNWADFIEEIPSFFKNQNSDWKKNLLEVSSFFRNPESFNGHFEELPFPQISKLLEGSSVFNNGKKPGLLHDFEAFASKKISLSLYQEKLDALLMECERLSFWPETLWVEKTEIRPLLEIFEKDKRILELEIPHFLKWLFKPKIRPFLKKMRSVGKKDFQPGELVALLEGAEKWFLAFEEFIEIGGVSELLTEAEQKSLPLKADVILMLKVALLESKLYFPGLQIIQDQAFLWKEWLHPDRMKDFDTFQETMKVLEAAYSKSKAIQEKWAEKFTEFNPTAFQASMENSEAFLQDLEQKKEAISQTDRQFLEQGPDFEALVREILAAKSEAKTPEDWTAFLDSSWISFWIKYIENQHPVLRETSKPSWAEEIAFLQNQIEEKYRLTSKILKLRLSENSYKDLEYNRLNNRVSYRELFHQVNKKRMKKPLRSLWQSHADEIKKLIPAWLATPESVSATWDMCTRFDLVIFDESSQCFAEKGLPAAFRGNTLVVVGDSKQLQPNQHFMARWENEEDADAVSDQVSLLDLATQFLPQFTLRGHYRSQFPELIAFSNLHFYQNKLEFLPHAQALRNRKPAIHWISVDGIWKNQQNEAEALSVAEKVFDFAKNQPDESLGIITFNMRQQMLIEQFVDVLSVEKNASPPTSFFIKNIENVQGDECDHIWFSIGYAPNEAGKINYQFGSLSQSGGENRLNVAITRARKSISLFCSMAAHQFEPGEQAPAGPRLLKQFLHYAWETHLSAKTGQGDFTFPEKNWWQEIQESSQENLLHPEPELILGDGPLLYKSHSTKDYFGYKPLIFRSKGFRNRFTYSRPRQPEL
jgi:hypothetical protein